MPVPTCSWEIPALVLSELSLTGNETSMDPWQEEPGIGAGTATPPKDSTQGYFPTPFPASAKFLDLKEGVEALEAGLYARLLPDSWTVVSQGWLQNIFSLQVEKISAF